jgi:hypothetical protein
MDLLITRALDGLREAGWTIELESKPRSLPAVITNRYTTIPPLFVEFATLVRTCERSDEAVWLLTAKDYSEPNGSEGFAWDSFETMITEPEPGHASFWDRHLPILQAVDADYEYLAIDTHHGTVVWAYVNAYDDTLPIAPDYGEFLRQLAEVGAAEPTGALVSRNRLALLVHPEIIDDGSGPRSEGFLGGLRRRFGL